MNGLRVLPQHPMGRADYLDGRLVCPNRHAFTESGPHTPEMVTLSVESVVKASASGPPRSVRRSPANKGPKLPGEVLSAAEVMALMRACGRGRSGPRNAALIAVMFGAGLRVSEALDLRPSDLDVEHGTVRVRHGKGDRARTVAIDPTAQAWVEAWLTTRTAAGLGGRQPLFCTITKGSGFGGRLDSSYVRGLLPRLARKAGIERRVHPHALRHSLATALAHEGKPLPVIAAQLGHSSTAVTDRYLAKIAPTDLIAQVRDRGRLG